MAQSKARVQAAAQLSFEGGVDSNLLPRLLRGNQIAWATNCRIRGGTISPRPGFRKQALTFPVSGDDTLFQTGKFQGAGFYVGSNGLGELMVSIGGRTFSIDADFDARDISPEGDPNSSKADLVTFEQAERWMIVQDGQAAPLIYNRSDSRRAYDLEVSSGSVCSYANGRLWCARGNFYTAGDLVGSSSGDPTIGRLDAVLKTTENTYLNEGGSFSTPTNSGNIQSLQVLTALDTVLGQGDLLVFTEQSIFATTVPTDRTQWKNLSYPVQRLVAPTGTVGPFSPVNVNGDIYYRSSDGIRSLISARRDFKDGGMTPLSSEIQRALSFDSPALLKHSSGVLFDNRLLHTCIGRTTERGVVHKGIVSLDFDPVSGLRVDASLAYDGLWTGLDFFHIVKGRLGTKERCFVFALSDSDEIELWELDPELSDDWTDSDSCTPIEWFFETKSVSFDSPFEMKRLDRFEVWLRDVAGVVDFSLYTRPDSSTGWNLWRSWQESVKIQDGLDYNKPSYRPRRSVANPPNSQEDLDPKKPVDQGYEFQFRLSGTGSATVDTLRFFAEQRNEDVYPPCPPAVGVETENTSCPLDDFPQIP